VLWRGQITFPPPPRNFFTLGTFANDSAGCNGAQECQNTTGRGCSVVLPTSGGGGGGAGGGNAGNPLSTPVFLRFPTQFCKLRRFYIIWFSQFRVSRHLATHLDCISGVGYPKKNSDRAVGNSSIASKTEGKQECRKGISALLLGVLDSGFKPVICPCTCLGHQVAEGRQGAHQPARRAVSHHRLIWQPVQCQRRKLELPL